MDNYGVPNSLHESIGRHHDVESRALILVLLLVEGSFLIQFYEPP